MYLFCPLGSYEKSRQSKYSSFLKDVQSARGTIFTSSLILSEFINRYLRLDFNQWKNKNSLPGADFKRDYMKSCRYSEAITEIQPSIRSILRLCEKTPDNFQAINIDQILIHLSSIDFNDGYYIELASSQNWKIVTDDRDFSDYTGHNLTVITIA